ncbi:DUF4326 superfamily protein [Cotonvirus japonicus]|uniref:DUF4326 superfamily protein n=1 Tax=Cotonvirus japonicus TaxID=2811091 RepID=A0ABM7NRY4_9VIRU|nr:DUF4326 superfamily protein [Cotonvirus japonicus]BCS82909.1 DUF4326 superfamily protein [Cotonvirus japonicus]
MNHELPKLVRIKRDKNGIIQDCDIYIGRKCTMGGWNLPESKWHNPYTIREYKTAQKVCHLFLKYIIQSKLFHEIPKLSGKTLGCWCDIPKTNIIPIFFCHGCVLIQLYKIIASNNFDTHLVQEILADVFC